MTRTSLSAVALLAVLCFSPTVHAQFANNNYGGMQYNPNDPRVGYCLKNDCFAGQGPYAHLQCLPLTSSYSLDSWFGGSGGSGYGGGYGYGGGGDCCGGYTGGYGQPSGCTGPGCGTPVLAKGKPAGKKPSSVVSSVSKSSRKATPNKAPDAPVGYRYKF